ADSPTCTTPSSTATVAGTAPVARTTSSTCRATSRLSGRGRPWLMIVDSRATTGRPAASADPTSASTERPVDAEVCDGVSGMAGEPRVRPGRRRTFRPMTQSAGQRDPAAVFGPALDAAHEHASEWLRSVPERPIAATATYDDMLRAFRVDLP